MNKCLTKTKPLSNFPQKLFKLAILALVMICFLSLKTEASHYRYGNISWSRINSTTRTITITVTQAWRRSFFGTPIVGSVVNNTTTLNFGDATSTAINITVTSVNITDDWFYGTFTVNHTYTGTATSFTLSYSSGARIGSPLQNNANGNFSSQSFVRLTAGNTGSPVSSTPPIINLPVGQVAAAFSIPATDPDATALTYALATSAQTSATNPAGLAISATGNATFNTVGKVAGQLWQGAFVITDASGSNTIVDFMMFMVAANTPPIFDYSITPLNNAVFNINPLQNLSFSVKALDVDPGSTVTLSAVGLPTGNFTFTPGLPVTANPVTSAFSFTPVFTQLGIYQITFTATRNGGVQTSTTVTVNVNTNPQFISPTRAEGSGAVILSNVLHIESVAATNPDPSVNTRITSGAIPAGANMSPALPTAFSTTPTSQMSWTPSVANFGAHNISFLATDANGRTATRNFVLDVNTVPTFGAKSDDNISPCTAYSYNITATDPDMAYGDIVDIVVNGTLPSWLTLTQTGNGTATLSGTPSHADAGTYAIAIDAEDLYYLVTGRATLSFNIVVMPDAIPPALTAGADQDVTLNGTCTITVPDVRGTATDNCTVSITQSPAVGAVVSSSHNGTVAVTVTATDVAGLTDIKTVTLTAKDITAPALTAGADQDVNLDGSCSITVPDVRGTATDNCTVSITQNPAVGAIVSSSHNGTISVTVTATDGAGLTDVKTVTLTAKDVTAPALTTGADQNVNLNGSCSIVVPDVRGTATDNCTVSITQSPAVGAIVSSSHNGTISVTVTATDGAGLTDVKTVILTAKDVTAPALTAGADQDVNLDGSCSITVPDVRGSATDNCTVSITQSPAAGIVVSSAHNGTISVTVTATDGAGLTDVKTVTLTAKDVTAPVLTAGANQNLNLNGSCSVTVPDVRGTATDNCSGTVITQSPAIGAVVSSAHNGTISVTVTATDGAGLTDVKTVTLTAKDITAPTISCPANIVLSACQSTATWTEPAGNDNCSGWTVTRTGPAPGSTFANGSTTTISYTATDLAGNTASCSFTVKRDATLGATVTNNNPVLYFGFTLDQLAKITVKPTGGTAPYTVAFVMNRPINCNLVNSSGDEIWTHGANTSLDSNITCVSTSSPNTKKPGSTSTNTITSATGYTLDVTLMQNAVIYITVTDAKGCKYLDSAKIHAEDVRCFAGNSNNAKVTVCHRTGSASNPCVKICIDQSAVQEHLSHGDFLGNCTPGCVAPVYTRGVPAFTFVETAVEKLNATVMPNPTTSFFEVAISAKKGIPVTMTVNDVYGRLIQKNTKVDANRYNQLGQNWKAGTYFIEVMQGNERKVLKVIKTN